MHTTSAAEGGPAHSSGDSLDGVSHEIFHKRLSSITNWFTQFTDIQRNRVLSDILVRENSSFVDLQIQYLFEFGSLLNPL